MSVIAVAGLGYVGFPLAVEFGKVCKTIGFDLSGEKVESFRRFIDPAGELPEVEIRAATQLIVTTNPGLLSEADFIIVAVPTPIDEARRPDLGPLVEVSRIIGQNMKKGAIVIYESTVYPGATEEICIPILEENSRLRWKKDFHVGYSPERINPGDKVNTLANVVKVVSGDDAGTLDTVAELYSSIVSAGVHRASSIQVAEASKVIENTQRDLNIALMNELAIIFNKIGIDTTEVLDAAGTKWNFLPFRPGLVGGHCIGVDPYYLTHKADMIGYHPQVILSGRRINDEMGKYIAEQTVKQMINNDTSVKGSRVHVFGLTFKENVPDLRNSRVIDLIDELKSYGVEVFVHDPLASPSEAMHEYGIELSSWEDLPVADAVVMAVAHRQYLEMPLPDYFPKLVKGGCFIDVKSVFDQELLNKEGFSVWRL